MCGEYWIAIPITPHEFSTHPVLRYPVERASVNIECRLRQYVNPAIDYCHGPCLATGMPMQGTTTLTSGAPRQMPPMPKQAHVLSYTPLRALKLAQKSLAGGTRPLAMSGAAPEAKIEHVPAL
jgi:hypothetical protein